MRAGEEIRTPDNWVEANRDTVSLHLQVPRLVKSTVTRARLDANQASRTGGFWDAVLPRLVAKPSKR